MDDYNILFERTRNQQHQHQSRMQDYEDDDDETTSDDELYATTCNNNVEEAKLIGSDEKKCSRRRRFRSYKPRKTLKCFFIISLVCVAFLIFSQFFINRDTYRSGMYQSAQLISIWRACVWWREWMSVRVRAIVRLFGGIYCIFAWCHALFIIGSLICQLAFKCLQ